MKALLINPYCIVPKDWIPYFPREPLALEYLAAIVKDEHKVRILDCVGEDWLEYAPLHNNMIRIGVSLKKINAAIAEHHPDIVGVTLPYSTSILPVNDIVNMVKRIDKDIITIVGGNPVSAFPEEILRNNPNIDIAAVGEGEITFKEILDKAGEKLDTIDGIVYKTREGEIKRNSPRKLISNLDTIPFPDRDIIPFQAYSKPFNLSGAENIRLALNLMNFGSDRVKKLVATSAELLSRRIRGHGGRVLFRGNVGSILTSRGCPFNCYYCCIQATYGRSYRMRSPKNVLTEMELLNEKYGVTYFKILDDNFTISKKRVQEICRGIIERGLDIKLAITSGVYLPSLDEETLTLMRKAGLHELGFGIESGNQEVLHKIINKRVNLQKVDEIARICERLGILAQAFFMVGVPRETPETMNDTINFAANCAFERIRLYICQPFPGSRLYEDCVEKGWLVKGFKPDHALIYGNKSYIKTENFSPNDVQRIAELGRRKLESLGKVSFDVYLWSSD